jgi:hypothetical protein
MSNDEYQMKQFFENQKPACVEKDEKGNCLMSMQFILFDIIEQKVLFCEELKTNKHDKTI